VTPFENYADFPEIIRVVNHRNIFFSSGRKYPALSFPK